MKLYKIRYAKDKSIRCSEYYNGFSEAIKARIHKSMNEDGVVVFGTEDQTYSLDINLKNRNVFEQLDPYIGVWYSYYGYSYTIFVEAKNSMDAIKSFIGIFDRTELPWIL